MNRYVHCQSGSIIAVTYDNNNIVYTQPQKRSRARARLPVPNVVFDGPFALDDNRDYRRGILKP